MMFKLLILIGSVFFASANEEHSCNCITFERCRQNPDEASTIFRNNKEKLEILLTQEKTFVQSALEDAINKLNAEISASHVDECKHMKVTQDAKYLTDVALNWCAINADYCSSLNHNVQRRDAEELIDCDDDSIQYCLNITLKNTICQEIDLNIHILENCDYLALFAAMFTNPWQTCIDEFNPEGKNCAWYQEALSDIDAVDTIDMVLIRLQEFIKRFIKSNNLNIPLTEINPIIAKWQQNSSPALEILLNLAKNTQLSINAALITLTPEQVQVVIDALTGFVGDPWEAHKQWLIEFLPKITLEICIDDALLNKFKESNINWDSLNDIYVNIDRILLENVPEWKIRKELVEKLLLQINVSLSSDDLSKLVVSLNIRQGIDWHDEADVLKHIAEILNINLGDDWETHKKWLEEFLPKITLELCIDEALLNKFKESNINWSSEIDIFVNIDRILLEDVPEWKIRKELVEKLLTQINVCLASDDLSKLVVNLNILQGINWEDEADVLKHIAEILNINLGDDWETHKKWLEEFLPTITLDLCIDDALLNKFKESNINWSSEIDIFVNIDRILLEGVPEWKIRKELVEKLLSQISVCLASDDLSKLVVNLNIRQGINWEDEADVLKHIAEILNINLEDDWEAHKKWLEEFLPKITLELCIDDALLNKFKEANINWSDFNTIYDLINRILSDTLPEWKDRRSIIESVLADKKITLTSDQFTDVVINLNRNENLDWTDKNDVLNKIAERIGLDLEWLKFKNYLIKYLPRLTLSDLHVDDTLLEQFKPLDYSTNDKQNEAIVKVLTDNSEEWRNRLQRIESELNKENIQLPLEIYNNVLLYLNTIEIDWSNDSVIWDNIVKILGYLDSVGWEEHKIWLEDFLSELTLEICVDDALLQKFKNEQICWSNENLRAIGIDKVMRENIDEWKTRRDLILEVFEYRNRSLTANLVIALSKKENVDWQSKEDVKLHISSYLYD